MAVIEDLSEEEKYLWALLQDESGLDIAEFAWYDPERNDGCFRAWPYQWKWWRCNDPLQIDQSARSVGKSLSIKVRAFAFPFIHPGQEMVITAPEGVHLDAITDIIETAFYNTRLGNEMLVRGVRGAVKHKPFHCIAEGQLVLTARGHIPIEQVVTGDLVLTHNARWRNVVDVLDQGVQPVVSASGRGHYGIKVTEDHEFYVRNGRWSPRTRGKKTVKQLEEPSWISPQDWLTPDEKQIKLFTHWASPAVVPEVERLQFDPSLELLWMCGLYIAEGCISGKSIIFTTHANEVAEVSKRLTAADLVFRVSSQDRPNRPSLACDFTVRNAEAFAAFLGANFGRGSRNKHLPAWVWSLNDAQKTALFEGYAFGDGNEVRQGAVRLVTSSKALACDMKLLAQTLGYQCGFFAREPSTSFIGGRVVNTGPSWEVYVDRVPHTRKHTRDFPDGLHMWSSTAQYQSSGTERTYDLVVEEDHSFVVEGIVVHNCNFSNGARIMGRIPQRDGKGVKGIHPLWLELDEAQDYPEAGWTELTETLKRGSHGAVWRAHGVTRGVRDRFWKNTQPESQWTVHRYPAMYRPTWSDEERIEKIEQYGGRDDPDYRRNVLGLHGDAMSPIFVLHRLMQCVDDNKESAYNEDEYFNLKVSDSYLNERSLDILDVLNFPQYHVDRYKTFWSGMDVGYTNHPSEILVFAEERPPTSEVNVLKKLGKAVPPEGMPRLKLIVRLNLTRIGINDQVRAILRIVDFYKPRAFSMDKTGNGLPLFQDVQDKNMQKATIIKGSGFSEKILVDFDQTVEVERDIGNDELAREAGIRRNTVEYATDVLRGLVDDKRLWLPWDDDLLSEFMGQTYKVERSGVNQYGKRSYSLGKFHALDAARMAVLGWKQFAIEKMMKEEKAAPVYDMFVQF